MSLKPIPASVTVTTAGTRVQVSATATPVASVYFEGLHTNTGKIYVGDSTVSSTVYIVELDAKTGATIEGDQLRGNTDELVLSDFWVDSSVNGEKVLVTYFAKR
jgi:hypothetical protein